MPPSEPAPRPRRDLGGAPLIALAVLAALVWANLPLGYTAFWEARVLGSELRTWVNEGLMTLFFLVVGLEAKREFDLGALRDRRRLTLPVLAALGGIATSAARLRRRGRWRRGGAWRSRPTPRSPSACSRSPGGDRVFLLTLLVVDDVVALLVISFVYSEHVDVAALVVAVALLGALLAMRAVAGRQFRATGTSSMALYVLSIAAGVGLWLALFESGIDPVVSGLAIGLLTNAYEPRDDAVSPNERIQTRFHPWTSLVVVPVFALANAGMQLDGALLRRRGRLGDHVGDRARLRRRQAARDRGHGRAPRRAAMPSCLRVTALSAGVGFTVSLLIASRAFTGAQLDQARVGILVTALLAPLLALASTALTRPRLSTCAAR